MIVKPRKNRSNDTKLRFAIEVFGGLSNREAAIKVGLSKNAATQAGARLASDKKVIEYLAKLKASAESKNELGDNEMANIHAGETRFDTQDAVVTIPVCGGDPKKFLESIMDNNLVDIRIRTDAAKSLMPYVYRKLGELGKKEAKEEEAKEAQERFAPRPAPRAVKVVN